MRRVSCVFFFLLSLSILSPGAGRAQVGETDRSVQENGFSLEQNYPNPFNPETKIPFILGEQLFEDGQPVRVSVRIYNVLQQFVAAPTALGHPQGDGVPLIGLEYTQPGRYEAYWDGRDRSGAQVASGVYFVQLTVNGRSAIRKMFVTK